MNESLEARLLNLQIDLPRGLSERALARGRMASKTQGRQLQRRSLRVALGLVAVSLIVAANLPAAYFFPRYSDALANAPFVGAVSAPVLRFAGLTNAGLTPADSSSVSNGHTLHLTAAYADSFRTVLIVEIDGQPLQLDRKPLAPPKGFTVAAFQLTDQFGHSYRDQRPSPFSPIEVDPLVGLAASAGARLTLHVTALDYYDLSTYTTTHGDWTLRATVFQVPGRVLPLPAPGSIGNTHYAVTYLSVSASLLHVHVAVTGDAPRMLQELPFLDPHADATAQRIRGEQQANLIRAYYRTVLMAPDGTEAPERSGGFGGDAIDETFVLTGPGTYHLMIGSLATGIYDAAITV